MILIDSVYINNGGGLVLLKYLVDIIENKKLDVFYLFDNRTAGVFENVHPQKKMFLSGSIYRRYKFYIKNGYKYSSILCFGNLPPPVKLQAPVYVYFHQSLFLNIPNDFSFVKKTSYFIKQLILNYYKRNATRWLVQSDFVANEFGNKYLYGNTSNIDIVPFYPPLNFDEYNYLSRVDNSFLYVSNSSPHKNHKLLIESFCNAFDKIKKGTLVLTIPYSSSALCELIKEKKELGYPINNVGFIEREELIRIYLTHQFLIFPSLAESFGLGLVEAIDAGCKVIASDLPYTYQVCKPSLTFDPHSSASIESAILTAVNNHLPDSKKIISNNIEHLVSLMTEYS